MKFTPTNRNLVLVETIYRKILPLNTSTTILGIMIDNNLDWEQHIEDLQKKLLKIIYALCRIIAIANNEISKISYHTLFELHLWNRNISL